MQNLIEQIKRIEERALVGFFFIEKAHPLDFMDGSPPNIDVGYRELYRFKDRIEVKGGFRDSEAWRKLRI